MEHTRFIIHFTNRKRLDAFSGQRTGMDVSVNDRYLLDGNLLFATNNGTYHQGGTEYISEVQTFQK